MNKPPRDHGPAMNTPPIKEALVPKVGSYWREKEGGALYHVSSTACEMGRKVYMSNGKRKDRPVSIIELWEHWREIPAEALF